MISPMSWRDYSHVPKVLTEEQLALREQKLAEFTAKRPKANRISLLGAATRWALHGPPPNFRQIAAYRRWKREREWKAIFPDVKYPGRGRSTSPTTRAGRIALKASYSRKASSSRA